MYECRHVQPEIETCSAWGFGEQVAPAIINLALPYSRPMVKPMSYLRCLRPFHSITGSRPTGSRNHSSSAPWKSLASLAPVNSFFGCFSGLLSLSI